MKKIATYAVVLALVVLTACQSNTTENKTNPDPATAAVPTMKLESKDVKGEIDTIHNHEIIPFTFITSDDKDPSKTVSYDGISIKLGDLSEINITPATKPFDSLFAKLRDDLDNWGKFDTVELKSNSFFYHTVNDFGNKDESGYNFLIVIKGKNKMYRIVGEGSHPLSAIADKAVAERTFKKALSFKPAE